MSNRRRDIRRNSYNRKNKNCLTKAPDMEGGRRMVHPNKASVPKKNRCGGGEMSWGEGLTVKKSGLMRKRSTNPPEDESLEDVEEATQLLFGKT